MFPQELFPGTESGGAAAGRAQEPAQRRQKVEVAV